MPCLVLQGSNEPQQPSISWVYQLQAQVFILDGSFTNDRVSDPVAVESERMPWAVPGLNPFTICIEVDVGLPLSI